MTTCDTELKKRMFHQKTCVFLPESPEGRSEFDKFSSAAILNDGEPQSSGAKRGERYHGREETKETEVKKGSGFTIIVEPLPFLGAPDNKRCVLMGASLK